MEEELAKKIEAGDASVKLVDGKVVLTESVETTFTLEEALQNVTNLTNKIDELQNGIERQKVTIAQHEEQMNVIKKMREEWRAKIKLVENAKATKNESASAE